MHKINTLIKVIFYFFIIMLLTSCATITSKQAINLATSDSYYKDWCKRCGNTGYIQCDNCYGGIMCNSEYKCLKCGGLGLIKCPRCDGKINPNNQWKLK